MKIYVAGMHKNCQYHAVLMGTHNIYFCGDIRKILTHLWLNLVKTALSIALIINPVSILYKSTAGHYRPIRVDGR